MFTFCVFKINQEFKCLKHIGIYYLKYTGLLYMQPLRLIVEIGKEKNI